MIDLKKITNMPVNLSVPKGLNKNPLMDKFRDNKTKRVNLKYKEDIEHIVVTPVVSEKSVNIRKHVEKKDKTVKNTSRYLVIADDLKQVNSKTTETHINIKVKLQKAEQYSKSVIKETMELSPEVIQAKEDLVSLKKTFSKLLLPVKWSRKSISANSED